MAGQNLAQEQPRNELYGQKQYIPALQEYLDAQDGDTHQQLLSYNIGNTLYRQQKYAEAVKALDKALAGSDPKLQQQIHFNRGNAFYRMGQYPQAIESYKRSLELAPDDLEAKHNLELALKKAEQQQENQKKQDEPNEENQNPQNGSKDQDRKSRPEQKSKSDQQDPSQSSRNQPPPGTRQDRQPTPPKNKPQGMDAAQAHRLLDALLSEEKEEQKRQALRLQRQKRSGKDW